MTTEIDPELKGWLLDFIEAECSKPWGTGPGDGGPVSLHTAAHEFFEGDHATAALYIGRLQYEGLLARSRPGWAYVPPPTPKGADHDHRHQ